MDSLDCNSVRGFYVLISCLSLSFSPPQFTKTVAMPIELRLANDGTSDLAVEV